ncbi:helix-turn-helix domain-containing protein [Marinactinospora rubrisoli]|uniref:Helix-turn-helix domain-containing protein n=1 Tax=Marinactinospora rubrisoli TaxID=2715399 RepID=A0ABW2KJ73_9ACTN
MANSLPPLPAANGDFDAADLGARIRALRVARGISLRALAGALGISPSAMSQIERGLMRPSVSRLFQITAELGVPLADAFGGAAPGTAPAPSAGGSVPPGAGASRIDGVLVSRGTNVPELPLGDGVRYRRLSPAPIPGLEVFESTYPPGAGSTRDGEYLTHAGLETGSVITGTLTIEFPHERHTLGPGDSIAFPSTTPHRIANHGEVPAVAIWTNLHD